MTYDGNNQTYEWDAANRLTAINYLDSGSRTEFAYDGLGRRVKITEYSGVTSATIQPDGSDYATFTTSPFTLPTGGYTITFQRMNPNGGDNTVLVDSVALNGALVPNGSFETPDVSAAPGGYLSDPTDTSWSFGGSAGVAINGSDLTSRNANAPDGNQVAFIEKNGSLWQTWSAPAGTYTLSLQAAQRASGNDSYQQLRVSVWASGSPVSAKTFVWSGNSIAEERDATGATVTKRFFAEGEQRIGGSDAGNYYYSRDHLGSVREVTDSSGNLVAQYDYDAWGNEVVVSGSMNIDFGFTGHYFHQPSGLSLALYRAYNPTLGRWLNRDPIGEAGGVNLYTYVHNGPTRLVDPFGLQDEARPPGIDGPGYYGAGTRNAQSLAHDLGPVIEAGGTLEFGCKGKDLFERKVSDWRDALFNFISTLLNFQNSHPTDPNFQAKHQKDLAR